MPIINNYLSVFVLIAVNLFPIFGVAYFGWNIFEIVILYVLETFIIGIFNAIKMFFVKGNQKFVMIPFFLFHFNFFIAIQTVFVVMLLGTEGDSSFLDGDGLTNFVETISKKDIQLSLGILAISHIFSLYHNFYRKRLFEKHQLGYFFGAPYKRIFVQQFVVILGAWVGLLFNTPIVYLILLVVFKTAIDMRTHIKMNKIREHSKSHTETQNS